MGGGGIYLNLESSSTYWFETLPIMYRVQHLLINCYSFRLPEVDVLREQFVLFQLGLEALDCVLDAHHYSYFELLKKTKTLKHM